MRYGGFRRYESVAEKRAKVQKKIEKMLKKKINISPLVLSSGKLANTWWGKAWNKNLESYADYSNRIGRGRSYLRNGFVLDLKINPGEVTALVQGAMANPYNITIKISEINKSAWNKIKKECEGKIESMHELIEGKFSKEFEGLFLSQDTGLFPSPEEINFNCTCPDWAGMCKHTAAALYGVGVKLDQDPKLFFTLRKIEIQDLIKKAVQNKTKKLLKKAEKKTSRVIDESDAGEIFGIAMELKK